MATPFSAICREYATIETDILRPESVPAGSVVFVNPAYAPTEALNGAGGIEAFLAKLIEIDVRQRSCTLIALLPNLHAPWHHSRHGNHQLHGLTDRHKVPWRVQIQMLDGSSDAPLAVGKEASRRGGTV